jgi:hypothetical protein
MVTYLLPLVGLFCLHCCVFFEELKKTYLVLLLMKRFPKSYTERKLNSCPFCGKDAYTVNMVKIPVCLAHKETKEPTLKCMCGTWVDIKVGRYGTYAQCLRCGNVNLDKILEVNGVI